MASGDKAHFSHPLHPNLSDNIISNTKVKNRSSNEVHYTPQNQSTTQRNRENLDKSGAAAANLSAGTSLIHVTEKMNPSKNRGLEQYRPSPG